MSNKIDNALDVLVAKLTADLVTGGNFKAVERKLINAFTQPTVPVLGLLPMSSRRTHKTAATEVWVTTLSARICCRSKAAKADEAITERLAEFVAALNAYNALGTPKGVVDLPQINYWYLSDAETWMPVGAICTLRLRTDGALLDP